MEQHKDNSLSKTAAVFYMEDRYFITSLLIKSYAINELD